MFPDICLCLAVRKRSNSCWRKICFSWNKFSFCKKCCMCAQIGIISVKNARIFLRWWNRGIKSSAICFPMGLLSITLECYAKTVPWLNSYFPKVWFVCWFARLPSPGAWIYQLTLWSSRLDCTSAFDITLALAATPTPLKLGHEQNKQEFWKIFDISKRHKNKWSIGPCSPKRHCALLLLFWNSSSVLIGYSPVIFEFSVCAKFNAARNVFWVNMGLLKSLCADSSNKICKFIWTKKKKKEKESWWLGALKPLRETSTKTTK